MDYLVGSTAANRVWVISMSEVCEEFNIKSAHLNEPVPLPSNSNCLGRNVANIANSPILLPTNLNISVPRHLIVTPNLYHYLGECVFFVERIQHLHQFVSPRIQPSACAGNSILIVLHSLQGALSLI